MASINRGASTITASGGANARVVSDIMTRAPAIKCEGVSEALKIRQWFIDNFDELKEIADYITESVYDDGFVCAMEKFCLG